MDVEHRERVFLPNARATAVTATVESGFKPLFLGQLAHDLLKSPP
jgi:hypothetical protein